jgi:low affinity Fe/Cu permease
MARRCGHPSAFLLALGAVVLWLVSGPYFHFSNTWQLVINTGTTIVTFLMVFLIQHSQNRDTEAVQVKLGELIRAVDGARDSLADLDDADDAELEELRARYRELAARARRAEARMAPSERA